MTRLQEPQNFPTDPSETGLPEELLLFTFNHFSEAAYWIRSDARIMYVNEAACSMLGYRAEELVGMSVWDFDPHFGQEQWGQHWRDVVKRKSFRFMSEHQHRQGQLIPVEISANYLVYEGEEYNFAFVRDLSEEKRSRQLLDALTSAGREIDHAFTHEEIFHRAAAQLKSVDAALLLLLLDEGVNTHLRLSYVSVEQHLVRAAEKIVGEKQSSFSFPLEQVELYRQVVTERKAIYLDDPLPVMQDVLPRRAKRFARLILRMFGFKSLIVVPFIIENQVRGLISIEGGALLPSDLAAFTAFSQQIAAAWHKAELYELARNELAERRVVQGQLRESEERFRRMADNISDGLTVISGRRIAYVNDRLCEILGYPRAELMQMVEMQFAAPEEMPRVKEFMQRVVETPETIHTFELWIERKDGERRFVQNRYSHDETDGSPATYYVVTTDITERKLAEDEQQRLLAHIQDQALRVQQLIETVPTGVCLLDETYRLVQSNQLGHDILERFAQHDLDAPVSSLGDVAIPDILSLESDVVWHDVPLDEDVYELAAQPLHSSGANVGYVLVIRDVTRERELRAHMQQQERLAAVGLLAGGIAHDFNNALMPITLYAEILAREPEISEHSRERLETILSQAKHAGALTQQILDFSRRSILKRISCDLTALVREQVQLLRRTLPEHIQIELNYDRKSHMVNVDTTRIQQAIMNLALNARDAMPDGGNLRLRIDSLHVREEDVPPVLGMGPGDFVCLAMEDTGEGIDAGDLEHIFEPFYTTKAPGLGSGLGLAQVYGIVKQHGGEVAVHSERGTGTVITIFLPEQKQVADASPEANERYAHGRGERILVVEDDASVRAALMDVLESLHYAPYSASHGREALELLEAHPDTALILSDMVMPEMGGQELFRALRARGSVVPFVMMTGHPLGGEQDERLPDGLSGWLMKSTRTEKLAQTLADILCGDEP